MKDTLGEWKRIWAQPEYNLNVTRRPDGEGFKE